MDAYHLDFLRRAEDAAERAGHMFPTYAAAEAALESGYGTSKLSIADNNLFGMKQHSHPVYGTHVLPTKEFINGEWVSTNASWVKYPDWAACFEDRIATLKRLQNVYPNYKAALQSQTGAEFVTNVSRTWSTDPQRANKVLAIVNAYLATKG